MFPDQRQLFSMAVKTMAQQRAKAYHNLSLLWDDPNNWFDDFAAEDGEFMSDLKDSMQKMNPIVPQINETLDLMGEYAAQVRAAGEPQKAKLDLRVEYARLFVGPAALPCPPYGSVYRERPGKDQLGLVMGESTVAVKNLYREAGLEMSTGTQLPDHISVELEFMHYLCREEAARRESKTTAAGEFMDFQGRMLKEHLGLWVPEFTALVGQSTEHDFYRALANLTSAYVELEIGRIDDLKAKAAQID